MSDFLNYGFAWIALILAFLTAVVYVTRKISNNGIKKNAFAASINQALRKPHKIIGLLLIAAGLIHGLFSSDTVWSLNIGTVCWLVSILLGINWLYRRKLKPCGGWMIYHRILTVVFIGTLVWHIVDVGGIRVFELISGSNGVQITAEAYNPQQTQNTEPESSANGSAAGTASQASLDSAALPAESSPAFQFDGVTLKDGTYTGSADAFGPGLTVSVKVESGKVTSVEIVSHHEKNARYYAAPIREIPRQIVESQSLDVDIVSGATFTSKGIVNAVIDALSGAVKSGQLPEPYDLSGNRRR